MASAKRRAGGKNFLNRSNVDFTHNSLAEYVFKNGLGYASLRNKEMMFRFNNDEKELLHRSFPALYYLLYETERGTRNFFLADSLSVFFRTEKYKSESYLRKESEYYKHLERIPFSPFLDSDFMVALQESVEYAKKIMNKTKGGKFSDGLEKALLALKTFKNKLYPSLSDYLVSTSMEEQERKYELAANAYKDFLSVLADDKDSSLHYFIEWLDATELLIAFRKRIAPLRADKVQDELSVDEQEELSKMKTYFQSKIDISFEIKGASLKEEEGEDGSTIKKKLIFAQAKNFSNFGFYAKELYATSPIDIMLHFIPVLEGQKENYWEEEQDSIVLKHFFFYRKLKDSEFKEQLLLAEYILADKIEEFKKHIEKLDSEDKREIEKRKIEAMNSLSSLIEKRTNIFLEKVRMLSFILFEPLLRGNKEIFYLSESEKTIVMMNTVRKAFTGNIEFLPVIQKNEDNLYAKLQNKILDEGIRSIIVEMATMLKDKKPDGAVSKKEKAFSPEKNTVKKETPDTPEDNADDVHEDEYVLETREDEEQIASLEDDTKKKEMMNEILGFN